MKFSDLQIICVEIVKGGASPFELKVYHGDGSWQYFSRGFSNLKSAYATAKKLSPIVRKVI